MGKGEGKKAWAENDELFFKLLKKGLKWQDYVTNYIERHAGVNLQRGEGFYFRESIAEADKFAKEDKDIVWVLPDGTKKVFEVKSRNFKFTGPSDFPYPTVMIETTKGWDKKEIKPDLYLNVSTVTKAIIALPVKATKDQWTTIDYYDRVRSIYETSYICPKELWVPVDKVIKFMKEKTK